MLRRRVVIGSAAPHNRDVPSDTPGQRAVRLPLLVLLIAAVAVIV
jgi:hypothetical protein